MSHDALPDAPASSKPEDELAHLEGELTAAPRGAGRTVLLAVTGLLLVIEVARVLARVVLTLRHPAVVRLRPTTIEVRGTSTLLGRVLRERNSIIPHDALIHATREIRYPRLGLYAGLSALTAGSYFGVGLTVDGLRASSPSLLGVGLLVVLLGLLLDFGFSSLLPGVRGRTRLLLVPRRGPPLCLASIDPAAADAWLQELSRALPPAKSSAGRRSAAHGRGADAVAGEAEGEAAEQPR